MTTEILKMKVETGEIGVRVGVEAEVEVGTEAGRGIEEVVEVDLATLMTVHFLPGKENVGEIRMDAEIREGHGVRVEDTLPVVVVDTPVPMEVVIDLVMNQTLKDYPVTSWSVRSCWHSNQVLP